MSSIDIYSILSKYPHNAHYLNKYLKFIFNFSEHECCADLYTERHHICPKSLFPEYKSFILNEWNKSVLPARAHFIAHWMLSKVFTDKKAKARMLKALNMMGNFSDTNYKRCHYLESKHYAIAAKANSDSMKIYNPMHDPEIAAKASMGWKKFLLSEEGIEYKKRISLSRVGITNISPEARKRASEFWKGVSRPQSEDQIQKIRESSATKRYNTPFGSFISVAEMVANRPESIKSNGPALVNLCKIGLDGYSIEQIKPETRGKYNRLRVSCVICGKVTNPSCLAMHYNSPSCLRHKLK